MPRAGGTLAAGSPPANSCRDRRSLLAKLAREVDRYAAYITVGKGPPFAVSGVELARPDAHGAHVVPAGEHVEGDQRHHEPHVGAEDECIDGEQHRGLLPSVPRLGRRRSGRRGRHLVRRTPNGFGSLQRRRHFHLAELADYEVQVRDGLGALVGVVVELQLGEQHTDDDDLRAVAELLG